MCRLQTFIFLVCCCLFSLIHGNKTEITVTEFSPIGVTEVTEGDDFDLQCKPDDWYDHCIFKNENTSFDYSFDKAKLDLSIGKKINRNTDIFCQQALYKPRGQIFGLF